jgi:glc operon protein GlcG
MFKTASTFVTLILLVGVPAVAGGQGGGYVEGCLPLVVEGKIVGAIGLSGGAGDQDNRCAEAGVAALAVR